MVTLRFGPGERMMVLEWLVKLDYEGGCIYAKHRGMKKYQRTVVHICTMVHGPKPSNHHSATHSCGNGHRGCINPKHIRWRTHRENMVEMANHKANGIGRWR